LGVPGQWHHSDWMICQPVWDAVEVGAFGTLCRLFILFLKIIQPCTFFSFIYLIFKDDIICYCSEKFQIKSNLTFSEK
jgi:hypothetical protein